MKVRMAQEKDIERIHSLLAQVAMVHHKGRPDLFKQGKSKYTDEELKALLQDRSRPILAAVDDNDCMQGYAFCIFQQYKDHNIMTDIKTLYIDDLCVDETMRGKHIGKLLYNAALDYAREHGCYNLTLNVWSCNESAMKFYESCGLKPQKVGMEVILKTNTSIVKDPRGSRQMDMQACPLGSLPAGRNQKAS